MDLIKRNIIPIMVYVGTGILILAATYLPVTVAITVFRISGLIVVLTPFVILTWLTVKEKSVKKEENEK